MGKVVNIKIGKKMQRYTEVALSVLPRKVQIALAIALHISLRRGISKKRIVRLILAKGV